MPTVEQLQAFIKQNPSQPFPRYGLALELKNQGRAAESLEVFAALVKDHPTYVPQYLHHAGLLVTAGKKAEARAIAEAGVAAAGKAGDGHAKGELEGLLASLDD
jgi:predicted Zn-dependent protease